MSSEQAYLWLLATAVHFRSLFLRGKDRAGGTVCVIFVLYDKALSSLFWTLSPCRGRERALDGRGLDGWVGGWEAITQKDSLLLAALLSVSIDLGFAWFERSGRFGCVPVRLGGWWIVFGAQHKV